MSASNLLNRNIKLDVLRITACFLIIMSHVSSGVADMTNVTADWYISHIYNTLGHTGTILFLFISGTLLLNKDYDFKAKKFYSKNFLRLLVAYILWIIIYHIIGFIQRGNWGYVYVKDVIINVIKGEAGYHFWYVPMLLGLYLILPMLRAITGAGQKLVKYFVLLFVVTELIFGTVKMFDFPYKYLLISLFDRIPLTLVETYAGYFVMGYFLSLLLQQKEITHPRITGGICLVTGVLLGVAGDRFITHQQQSSSIAMNSLFSLTLCLAAVGIYILNSAFTYSGVAAEGVVRISRITFGVYMIHPLIISGINVFELLQHIPSIAGIPLLSLVVFIVSYICIRILALIPFIRKWFLYA